MLWAQPCRGKAGTENAVTSSSASLARGVAERREALRHRDAGPSSRARRDPAGSTGTGATDREVTLTAAATAPPACRLSGRVRGHTWTPRPLPGPAGRPSCCCRRCRHPPTPGAAPASLPRPYGAAAAPADELIRPGPPCHRHRHRHRPGPPRHHHRRRRRQCHRPGPPRYRRCRSLRRPWCGQASVWRLLSAELASPPQGEADLVDDKLPFSRQRPCGQEGHRWPGALGRM